MAAGLIIAVSFTLYAASNANLCYMSNWRTQDGCWKWTMDNTENYCNNLQFGGYSSDSIKSGSYGKTWSASPLSFLESQSNRDTLDPKDVICPVSIRKTADGCWKWTMDASKSSECKRIKIGGYSTTIIASDNYVELFEGSWRFSKDKVASIIVDDKGLSTRSPTTSSQRVNVSITTHHKTDGTVA